MKKSIALLLLSTLALMSCEDNSEINKIESEFAMDLGLKFIFLDSEDNDLINREDTETYPVSYKSEYTPISEDNITDYQNELHFNGCTLTSDSETGKNVWETIVYGFDNIAKYKTYVRFANNDIDTLLVDYSFSTECLGRSYCAEIEKAYYNGLLIYAKESATPDFVYITKSGEQTSIELK